MRPKSCLQGVYIKACSVIGAHHYGTNVYLANNPLECDCPIEWISYWFPMTIWLSSHPCLSPKHLINVHITQLDDYNVECGKCRLTFVITFL